MRFGPVRRVVGAANVVRVLRRPAAATIAGVAALLVLSACASSTPAGAAGASGSAGGASGSAGVSSAAASGSAAVISTASGPDGTYLTGPDGRAVYLWVADTSSTSTCTGSCAAAWPPVTTTGNFTASGSAAAADLGTTKRSDGAEQATYDGHPLYYYAGDSAAGQTNGQGSDGFGAQWWLVAPSGSAITTGASGSGSSGSGAAPPTSNAYPGY